MKYTDNGIEITGHWEYDGAVFDGDNLESVRDDMWAYVKENCDIDSYIEDEIDEMYSSASYLWRHMNEGNDADDVKEEAIENIGDDLDTLVEGEDYDIAGQTFVWVTEEPEKSEEEIELEKLEERINFLDNEVEYVLDTCARLDNIRYNCKRLEIAKEDETSLFIVSQARSLLWRVQTELSEKRDAQAQRRAELKKILEAAEPKKEN